MKKKIKKIKDINICKSFNKIKIGNEFFCISEEAQFNILNYDNALVNSEKSLNNCFEKKYVKQIIVLDNKIILANISSTLISYYNYNKSKYDKFFNILNKKYNIVELCKLNNNSFCFLSGNDWVESPMILVLFDENFANKEKEIKNINRNEEISNHNYNE
jgi:hypothetical protein